jgi:hypothetical protein
MKKLTAITLAIVIVTLVVPGLVHAQDIIAIGGTLQAADCQTGTLTLKTADGAPRVFQTTSMTGVYVNSAAADRCTLPQYAGRDATVWITAAGDHLVAGRVEISAPTGEFTAQPSGYGYGPYGYGPYQYGPYFDRYYNPYLNFDPYYYGTYLYPFSVGIDLDGGLRDRDFGHRRFDRGDRDFHRGDGSGARGGAMHGGSSGPRMTGGFPGRSGSHGGGRR